MWHSKGTKEQIRATYIHIVRLVDSGLLLAAAVLLAALLGCCSKLLAAAAEQKIPHQPNTVGQGSSSEQLSDERT